MAEDSVAGDTPAAAETDALQEAEAEFDADLARLLSERDELRGVAQRLQADLENYKKQTIKRQTEIVERANQSLLESMLPVLDSFELALLSLDGAAETVRKGVELVYAELVAVLEKEGLSRIEAVGKPFDPNEHEAVMQDDGDGEPVVAEVLRTGYRLKGHVVRPAMVRVARGGDGTAA